MKDTVWNLLRAYQDKAPTLYQEARVAALTIPTLEQFVSFIRRPRGGMTAGISGCTYNMMSHWSDAAVEQLHMILTSMSREGLTPTFWNHRWLASVPKPGEKSVKNMRPITLVEVLAKLWHGYAVSALWEYVERNQLMCSTNRHQN